MAVGHRPRRRCGDIRLPDRSNGDDDLVVSSICASTGIISCGSHAPSLSAFTRSSSSPFPLIRCQTSPSSPPVMRFFCELVVPMIAPPTTPRSLVQLLSADTGSQNLSRVADLRSYYIYYTVLYYYILYTIYYILYTIYYILYTIYYILYPISYILYTIYYILYTIYYILYTIYYILYTIYYILFTIYYILYTILPVKRDPVQWFGLGRFCDYWKYCKDCCWAIV